MLNISIRNKIKELKQRYDKLKIGKESLLNLIQEAEVPEMVYNSNAIENSTLTLRETEKILLKMDISRNLSLREVFEARNLARVIEYIKTKSKEELSVPIILFLHKMLIDDIDEKIAGRFRQKGEYVRIGSYVAPAPKQIKKLLETYLVEYTSDYNTYFLDKIAGFHLNFEALHPFNDGNGRIGRAIINYQLQQLGFPCVIIRNKEKEDYNLSFQRYEDHKDMRIMERIILLALLESLHKRIAYLEDKKIISLMDYAKAKGKNPSQILNAAKRQTIPAFREKGVWKTGAENRR